jgi:asparagine synthase (glutamine-hydrolysing)
MCGLIGLYSQSHADTNRLERSLDALAHRGPDARAIWVSSDSRVILGHARLRILDLSEAADQPMVSPDGRWVMIHNGEIVNFADVRRNYRGPWNFRTSGDTEVMIASFAARGLQALHEWVGMFAFALLDTVEHKLYLVRDRFGVKPLYWALTPDGGFVFGSEIPAILPFLKVVAPNQNVVRTYLETGIYDCGRWTFFDGIQSLEPGSALIIDLEAGTSRQERWYRLSEHITDLSRVDAGALVEKGRALVHAAVCNHLVSDVRVGLNVSGGVDSSLLLALTRQYADNIHVFTQIFEPPYSEARWVRQIADGNQLHLASLASADIKAILHDVVRWQAEPFGGVTVCGCDAVYSAAQREGVTVLLDGNGVDEVFLGYDKYRAICEQADANSIDDAVAGTKGRSIDGTIAVNAGAVADCLRRTAEILPVNLAIPGFGDVTKAIAAGDLLVGKMPRALRFNDRMSMARSKELRVPFLDHRLVEFGFSVPTRYLLDERGNKALFRQIAEAWIPRHIAWAPKRSVQSPQREWLADDWAPLIRDILQSPSFAGRGWIDPRAAMHAYNEYCSGRRANSFFIWQWLNLELWARAFFD